MDKLKSHIIFILVEITNTLVSTRQSQKNLDSSFYKQFIENSFNKVDNLIDINFEL